MIHVDENNIQCNGSRIEILSQFTALMHNFIASSFMTKEEILQAVDLACLSDEELERDATLSMLSILTSIFGEDRAREIIKNSWND